MAGKTTEFDFKSFLKTASVHPGVYRMLDHKGEVIYVGKARSLKKRLGSYFTCAHNDKILNLVSRVADIQVTVTHTEAEALLLEDTLIKKHRPRYNILLRDDKSYPYICVTTDQEFPRISLYRGKVKNKSGSYFGPYANVGAVRKTLDLLHRLFKIRQCNDSYFRNRSRPCLQYQIKRCSAPCVGLVSREEYSLDIDRTVLFLKGKTSKIIDDLVRNMEQVSKSLQFEEAAMYRDQIYQLRMVLEKQYVCRAGQGRVDVIACALTASTACIQRFRFQDGTSQGNQVFYPVMPTKLDTSAESVLSAFISQVYLYEEIPREIITSHSLPDAKLIESVLCDKAGRKVSVKHRVRQNRAHWLQNAIVNANESLQAKLASKSSYFKRLLELQQLLDLSDTPACMECFDISHQQGRETVASCVVFDRQGAVKSGYRRFNITDITPGDDYAAISQAFTRRYSRVLKEEGILPDIVFIDGGKGQLSAAMKSAAALFTNGPLIIGISKGPERKAGMEMLHIANKRPVETARYSGASLLIQNIRDEAHRFAITGHRSRARNSMKKSILEQINGLGPKRRQLLLGYFGGIHGIKRAGIEDLSSVHGISVDIATRVYEFFHQ